MNAGFSVLAVDDNMIQCKATRKILEPENFQVDVCRSGAEAIRFLVDEPVLPDMLLLDIVRPC